MNGLRHSILLCCLLLMMSLLVLLPGQIHAIYGIKDDRVHFAVVRFTPLQLYVDGKKIEDLDLNQTNVENYAVFSQPFHLSEPDSAYVDYGTFFFKYVYVYQNSRISKRSRYTGGDFFWLEVAKLFPFVPEEHEFRTDIKFTFDNVHPDTIVDVQIPADYHGLPAQDLWDRVKHTNIPNKVASYGRFAAYGLSGHSSGRGAIFQYLILQNIPTLPEDVIIAGMESPLEMMTGNLPVTPEVRLLNRGHEPAGGSVSLVIRNQNGVLYEDETDTGTLPPDSFRTVSFKPFTHAQPESLDFRFHLSTGGAADSAFFRSVQVMADPVFKGRSLWDMVGKAFPPEARLSDDRFPPVGKLYGPDENGMYGIVTNQGGTPNPINYLKNKGDGEFQNLTNNLSTVDLSEKWWNGIEYNPPHITFGDINNDGLIDSVWTGYSKPRVYLRQESGELLLVPGLFDSVDGTASSIIFDYNQDGISDILILRGLGRPTVLLRGEVGLKFTDVTAELGPFPDAYLGDAGDLNGDGYSDIVLRFAQRYNEPAGLFLFINEGGQSFIDRSYLLTTKHKYIGREIGVTDYIKIIDMDGDGDNDIFGQYFYFANLGFSDVPVSIKTKDTPKLPSKFNLRPAYPNPFNPSTTIHFDMAEAGNVRIVIYNVLGQQVAEMVNDNLPAGSHQRVWDAVGFGSGIYLVKMEAKDFSKTVKITLLK